MLKGPPYFVELGKNCSHWYKHCEFLRTRKADGRHDTGQPFALSCVTASGARYGNRKKL